MGIERSRDRIPLTDPRARAAQAGGGCVGCSARTAMDAKRRLIDEQQVHSKAPDPGLPSETADAAGETRGAEKTDAAADRGCLAIGGIGRCVEAGVTPHVPTLERSAAARDGRFPKFRFRHDPATDSAPAPQDSVLHRLTPNEHPAGIHSPNMQTVRHTGHAPGSRCAGGANRCIPRVANEAILERMARRIAAPPGPDFRPAAGNRPGTRSEQPSAGWAKARS